MIDDFLFAINNPKAFSLSKSLGITPDFLKTNADSIFSKATPNHSDLVFLHVLARFNKNELEEFKNGINADRVDEAIKETFKFSHIGTDAYVYRQINIIRKSGDTIDSLLSFGKAVDSALKKDNFIFRYITRTPGCEALFSYRIYGGISYTDKQHRYRILQQFPENSIIDFFIIEHARDFLVSEWYILPHGSYVLTYFRGYNVLSFIPNNPLITIPNTVSYNDVCVVFNSAGEIIKNFTP